MSQLPAMPALRFAEAPTVAPMTEREGREPDDERSDRDQSGSSGMRDFGVPRRDEHASIITMIRFGALETGWRHAVTTAT